MRLAANASTAEHFTLIFMPVDLCEFLVYISDLVITAPLLVQQGVTSVDWIFPLAHETWTQQTTIPNRNCVAVDRSSIEHFSNILKIICCRCYEYVANKTCIEFLRDLRLALNSNWWINQQKDPIRSNHIACDKRFILWVRIFVQHLPKQVISRLCNAGSHVAAWSRCLVAVHFLAFANTAWRQLQSIDSFSRIEVKCGLAFGRVNFPLLIYWTAIEYNCFVTTECSIGTSMH